MIFKIKNSGFYDQTRGVLTRIYKRYAVEHIQFYYDKELLWSATMPRDTLKTIKGFLDENNRHLLPRPDPKIRERLVRIKSETLKIPRSKSHIFRRPMREVLYPKS